MGKGRGSVLVLLLAAICLGSGCSPGVKEASSNAVTLKNGPVYFMAGRIEAGEKAAISSRITARVNSVNVEVGSRVEKGAPLIHLESEDLAAQVALAQAGVEQVEASIDGARVSQEKAKNTCDRYQQLFAAGAVSKAQLEQAQAELAATDSALNAALAKLSQAQASLELASQQMNNGIITSPIHGVISAVNINAGELAVSGAQLLYVVNPDSLVVNAYCPAYQAAQMIPEQKVVIKVSELSEKFYTGYIAAVDSVIDSKNGNLLVKVQFIDQDPLLKPGMFAQIGINYREALP